MAKLQDIAAVAGVSVSTVSKALRGFKEISVETRRRVSRAARDMGYTPAGWQPDNGAGDTVGTIGVICVEIRSSYYAQVVGSIESALKNRGYSMLLGLSNFSHDTERLLLDRFLQQQVDGILVITNTDRIDSELRDVRIKHGLPVLLLAATIAFEDFDYVKINNDLGIRTAVEYLADLGHTAIGFVGDVLAENRLKAFRDALPRFGLAVREELVSMGADRFEPGGYMRMKELLERPERPTAVVASYDDVAIGAMRAIDEAGLSVPDDISIIGFDGIEVGRFLPTPLSTVASQVEEMADSAVRMLLRKVESPTVTVVQHLEINPELIIRASTGPPK